MAAEGCAWEPMHGHCINKTLNDPHQLDTPPAHLAGFFAALPINSFKFAIRRSRGFRSRKSLAANDFLEFFRLLL